MKERPSVAVFWFRRDLRLHDNHGLYQALTQYENVLPVFVFDRSILDPLRDQRDKRVTFIHQTLEWPLPCSVSMPNGWLVSRRTCRKYVGCLKSPEPDHEGVEVHQRALTGTCVGSIHDGLRK